MFGIQHLFRLTQALELDPLFRTATVNELMYFITDDLMILIMHLFCVKRAEWTSNISFLFVSFRAVTSLACMQMTVDATLITLGRLN